MKIQKFPFYNPFSNTLITSWFWSHRPHHIEQAGKTDVLLAAYGYQHMDIDIVNHVLHNDDFHHTKFSINYLSCEDVRILELIRKERPSTAKYIDLRLDTRLALLIHKSMFIKLKLYSQICYFSI